MEVAISVILPVYNAMPYLQEAVESILQQTLRDFELIIIDDASTDGSVAYVESLSDPRIIFLRNDINSGAAAARNQAMALARAPYIAFMDADDISAPQRLEKQKAYLDTHPQHIAVSARVHYLNARKLLMFHRHRNNLVVGLWFTVSCAMIRTQVIRSAQLAFPPLKRAEDLLFCHYLSKQGYIENLPETLYHYRCVNQDKPYKNKAIETDSLKKAYNEILSDYLKREISERELNAHLTLVFDTGNATLLQCYRWGITLLIHTSLHEPRLMISILWRMARVLPGMRSLTNHILPGQRV